MIFLGFPPYFIFTSFLTTLLLDRGVHVTGNKQFSTSSPWYPSAPPPQPAKPTSDESEALKKVLPLVTFDCRGKTGYFPDSKFNCEVFHYCQPDGARNTFHCPSHQLFNQLSLVCEEKTVHNSKLCREGSINPSNYKDSLSNKKHDAKQKASAIIKPLLNSNNSAETTKKIVTLEDLLSYMNSEQNGKEAEPTFISRFYKAEDTQKSKTLQNSAIATSKDETKSDKAKKPSKSTDSNLNAEGSDKTYSVVKVPSKAAAKSKKTEEEETVSAEYDAIEGRKVRKHKRVGRVLDIDSQSEKEKKPHSHMTVRSASEAPQQEGTTVAPPAADSESKQNSSAPSLFSTDRNKARKRKRYQGRKRKITTTPESLNEADMESVTTPVPTLHTQTQHRQDYDTMRNNANRRRKSQRTRTRDDSQRVPKPEKVEPYTLPPLPTMVDERVETTTETMQKEERKRTKNPWYKTTTPPTDDGVKYGEKISDQQHYQTDTKMMGEPAPPEDFYGAQDIPSASEDLIGEEYREKFQSNTRTLGDARSSHRAKVKNPIRHNDDEDDGYKYGSFPENHPTILPENLFPPPRAEAREHHSTPPKQMMLDHEPSAEKPKTYSSYSKTTTEDPFKVTYPYMGKYHQAGVQELKELEEQRWKKKPDKPKSEKKVAVGSTFFFQNSATPETTKVHEEHRQIPTTTETPVTASVNKEKDMTKHTLAHQHLSKIMNDFFAMSSTNIPGRMNLDSIKNEEDIIIPDYRIPDEDIYTSESATEDVEEIPPELLEVVDLITGNARSEKRDSKPQPSHEIIKINGPITDSHLEKIFLDDKFDEDLDRQPSEDGSYKKIVVIPRPEIKEENRDFEEMDEITTLKLEPLLKQFSEEKSLTVIPLKSEPVQKRQPTVLTAKKIPVRVIYRDQLTETIRPKQSNQNPNIKIVQTHLSSPRMKITSHQKRPTTRPISHPIIAHSQPPIVLHPRTLYPPHPPPLRRKPQQFRVGYPFVTNSMAHFQNSRRVHSRRKRSIMSRLRRQIRQNQHFLPFSRPVYPSFNPKFVPTFSPFKALFSPTSLHSSSSHLAPFTFPGFPLEKPPQKRPHVYRPNHHPRAPPVRHVTQTGHQTVIVEEVPVPIPVEIPSPNLIPPPSVGIPPKQPPRYPGNQFRTPSPPAIQTPPLIQRPQYRFPPPPNSYRPFGMPANARPPPMDYRSPLPLTGPLPPRITSQGQIYALGVTNKPILPPPPRPGRPPNGSPNPPRSPPRPHNPFNIHANEYPNFPYFQGAFTTPISNEPVPGRIMYSGYKPPKSTVGTKPPKHPSQSHKDRKPSETSSSRTRSKPSQDYYEASRPMRESHVSYTEEVLSKGRSRPKPKSKPNLEDYSTDNVDFKPPRQNLNKNSASSEDVSTRKRRPGRRRRPRPYSTTTQGTPILNDISPTPPPPEQIPPPPADYTSKPSHHEVLNSLPSSSEGTKAYETSSHFPPAGYYGKDQLVQFFDTSSKAHQKTTSPRPYHLRSLGEGRASTELDDSIASMSMEDGNEPAFGTRLRAKSQSQSRSRQQKNKQPPRSQTQKNEVRARPIRPEERGEKKEISQAKPNEGGRTQARPDRPPPRRRRPPPSRPRNRPPPRPQIHHFNYNENMGNFYSVPPGLQNLVAPSAKPPEGFRGSTDMFGIPHPVIDQNIYSLRPQGAPVDFDPNFFSVPAHVAQQQQSPLHKMNIKPVPESAREFFTAPETGSTTVAEASAPEKKESEHRNLPNKSGGENKERDPPVRKLRKPKRKNRYNPHSTEQRDSTEVQSVKPYTEQVTPRDTSTTRYREKSTTFATTTAEPHSTASSTNDIRSTHYHSQNDIKESPVVFKQRTPLLPKTLPEISKSLLNGKIDIQKLNATISTSVSVSGAIPQTNNNNTSSEEKENKRVFSSQNGGGLAVVRKGPKRKRARQRVSTTTGVPYVNNESSTDAKYEIAASVLDIIKATTETERQASGFYDSYKNERTSKPTNTWVESSSNKRHPA